MSQNETAQAPTPPQTGDKPKAALVWSGDDQRKVWSQDDQRKAWPEEQAPTAAGGE